LTTDMKDGEKKIPELSIHTEIQLEDEMKRSYLDYSMSVLVGRALPDVRDGLKFFTACMSRNSLT
jgi:DNA gyrase subunit A